MNAPAEKVINKLGYRIAHLECDNAIKEVALEELTAELATATARITQLEATAPKPAPPKTGDAHA